MLNNIGEIKNTFLIRIQGNTSVSFYTDSILDDFLNQAHRFSAGYHKWPFTEGRVSTTYTTAEEWNFEGYKADSFRMIQVGGKMYEKKNFRDYQLYLEENPNGDDKIYSDYGRTLFINPYAGGSGTLVAYGQYMPAELDTSVPTTETVFSPGEEEGNEAIVNLMLSYAKEREIDKNSSNDYYNKAVVILDNLWNKHQQEQYAYQTHDTGMFKRIDILNGSEYGDEIKRNQF
jgi:hypothetical protein